MDLREQDCLVFIYLFVYGQSPITKLSFLEHDSDADDQVDDDDGDTVEEAMEGEENVTNI